MKRSVRGAAAASLVPGGLSLLSAGCGGNQVVAEGPKEGVASEPDSQLRAIGIAGSPRRRGNSTTLLEAALKGAAGVGAHTQLVCLNDLTFRGCQACEGCYRQDRCVLDDDLAPVLEALRKAAIWVLAAPIYFDGVSAQFKSFFDRLHSMIWGDGKLAPQLSGRRRAAIITTSGAEPYDSYLTAIKSLAGYFAWMGDFGRVEVMCEGGLGPVGAVAEKPQLLEKAEALGKTLVEELG
jgi:multimeric flavodoxin WrbA